MTSRKDMFQFLQNCFSGGKSSRRSRAGRQDSLGKSEVMEERRMLTVDLQDVLWNSAILNTVEPTTRLDSYFVKFDTPQNVANLQGATGATTVRESRYVENGYTLEFANTMTVQQGADLFAGLRDFDYLHPNIEQIHQTRAVPNDTLYDTQWHLNNTGQAGGTAGVDINIEGVWDNYTGAGVTIGIVDDGLEVTHEDIAPNVNTQIDFDWLGDDNDPSPGANDFHGTAVAGLASAKGNNGVGVSGSAWDAELVGLRLIGGFVTDQDEADALSHELNTIDIYNNSWGPIDSGRIAFIGPQALAALELAATQGRNGLGNIHTWAGGNGGDNTNDNVNYDPYANSRFTIAVGASTNLGQRSSFSDPGASLVVVSPSNGGTTGLVTTDITGANGYDASNYASQFGGTSGATPIVSGVIALMLEANPTLTYRDVTDILAHTSQRIDPGNADWSQNGAGLWVNHEYGFGQIDAGAAVAAALTHTNLAPEESYETGTITVAQAIPDGSGSITQTVTVNSANAIDSLEYVEIVVNATHGDVGHLEIVLTSPSGTRSVLSESRLDPTDNLNNYVFTTVRNWDESSLGNWTLEVADRQSGSTGQLNSFELRFYGTPNQFLNVTESGGSTRVSDLGQMDSFDVTLPAQPDGDVLLTVTTSDASEVTATPTQLRFTPLNWNVPQTVTVNGVTDLVPDGNQVSEVLITDGVESVSVTVTSIDDDGTVPGPPTFTSPEQLPDTNRPIFAWVPGIRSARYDLEVFNHLTGTLVQTASGIAANSFAFPSPFPDGLYRAVLTPFNSVGQAGIQSEPLIFNIGDPVVPGRPVITAPSTGSVLNINTPTIVWEAVAGAVEYELYITTGGQVRRFTTTGTDVGNGEFSYPVTDPLAEGTTSVWVRGLNFFGDAGQWSAVARFTVDAFAAPSTPVFTAPLLSVTSNAFPIFEWTDGGDSATAYQLWVAELRDGTGTPQVPAIYDRVIHLTNHTELNYQHFSALNEKTHRAWVRSFNAAGEASRWSSFVEFMVDVPAPQQPVLDEIGTTQDTTPQFTWSLPNATPGTTYRLWVNNLSTGESRVIDQSGIGTTSYTPSGSLAQGRLAAWVQATNSTGERGPWSERMVVDLDVPTSPAPVVTGPVADPDSGSDIIVTEFPKFSWDPAFNAVRYELWVNHVDTRTGRIIHETDIRDFEYTSELPLPQGRFTAWVRGINVADEVGEWSEAFHFTLDVPTPVRPVVIAPTSNSVGTVEDPTPTIVWAVTVPATSYDLEIYNAGTGALVLSETGLTETNFTVPVNLPEQEFRIRVRGVNSIAEPGEWSEDYFITIDEPNATTPVALGPTGTVNNGTVTFLWRHSSDSVRYEILVRDLVRQENIVIQAETFDVNVGAGTAQFQYDLPDGTYRFWVRAFNSQGTASGWSNSLSFIVDDPLALLEDEFGADDEALLASLKHVDVPVAAERQIPPAAKTDAPVEQAAPAVVDDASVEAVMAEFANPQNQVAIQIEERKS